VRSPGLQQVQVAENSNREFEGSVTPGFVNRMRRRTAHRLRGLAEPARRKLSGTAPRSSKEYATHIPILVALGQHFRIEQVLELGCGNYSTPTFLNQRAFRNVKRLYSFDNDESWIKKVNAQVGNDPRYYPHFIDGQVSSTLFETSLEKFDLVFVDDSTSAEERGQTIRSLSARKPSNVLVVIHDYEVNEYRAAAADFEHRHTFKAFTPQTAVVWNGNIASTELIRRLQTQIKRFARTIEPDDVDGWLKVLSR
jgi:predicted O-methyltransferase YrrM